MKDKKERKKIAPLDYTKKERLIMALMTSLSVTFTYFLYGPIDIFSNNMTELSFNLLDVLPAILLAFFLSFAAAGALLFLLKSYFLNIITAGLMSLFISGIIDNNFTNKVVYTSGDASRLSLKNEIIFFATYIVFFYILAFISIALKKKWKNVLIFLCVLLFATNGAALANDFATKGILKNSAEECQYVASNKNLYKVSDKENIIVILFDRMDTKYYDAVVEKYPGYFDDLEGFTYYDSATTSYSRTFPAVTSLITNNMYYNDKSPKEYFEYAYTTSPVLKDLKSNGYDINLYIDKYYEYDDAVVMKDYVNNVEEVKEHKTNVYNAWSYLTGLSVSRNFSYFLAESSLLNAAAGKTATLSEYICEDGIYHDNDAEFYKALKENGLSASGSDKNYTFLYLHGSHAPHILDENCEPSKDAGIISQTVGAFKIVFEYLDQLKKLGVYDNSTIIITADHGYAISDSEDYFKVADSGITACMFVKPRNAGSEKLKTSSAQISITNLVPTFIQDAELKTDNEYGKSVFDIKEGETQIRTLYQCTYTNKLKFNLNEYEINGDAKELKNWTLKNRIESNYSYY